MNKLERYLWAIYSDIHQPNIMTETPNTFPNPDMPTITGSGIHIPKTDVDMTYLEKKNTNESIFQNLRKKGVYKSDMHKIYNLIVGQTN